MSKLKFEANSYGLSAKWNQMKRVDLPLILCIAIFSCSSDSDESEEEEIEQVDLNSIEGRYKGVWTWEIGDGTISMVITSTGVANRYSVDYFESNNYRPRRRLDGVSPDARGLLNLDGTNVSIDLNHVVDDPPCPGKFTGTGTFNENGELELSMNIDDCFAENEPATWKLEKRENL